MKLTVSIAVLAASPALAAPASQRMHARQPANVPSEYIVMLSAAETRPWPAVFNAMGWANTTRRGAHSFGSTFAAADPSTKMQTFGTNFRAFTIPLSDDSIARLKNHPSVAGLQKNYIRTKAVPKGRTASAASLTHGAPGRHVVRRQFKNDTTILLQQDNAPWNLQRISSASAIPPDGRLITELTYKYRFDQSAGTGVDVYVVDSGLTATHPEFGGRASVLFSAFGQDGGRDGDGHGTHVAGTVGSLHFGVAKNATIFGCKVLDDRGSGSDASIAAGIDAALTSHVSRMNHTGFRGSIINLSLGSTEPSPMIFDVLSRAVAAGMHVTIAPGNDNKDACTDFPAGFNKKLPSLFSVGATDIDDIRATFSDNGPCVDIHAPGVGIVSTSADGRTKVDEGTSMASPAVAGVIAAELSRRPEFRLDPLGMKKLVLEKAQKGVIKLKNGDKAPDGGRVLLNTGFAGNPA
ncbi:Cerevisin [Drechslerella dactyloides]|uniref:Cerevisin n=1 Tax=Drechslerella dactyloides TaxID=74499 RepID=A0AAD6IPJ7_DREDA|nr:Cerevisin [Drechslerella dactyloides]